MFARLACVLILLSPVLSIAAMSGKHELDIEQRLTAEQLRATGIDTLTPEQLKLLNRLLRDQPVDETQIGAAPAQPAQIVQPAQSAQPAEPVSAADVEPKPAPFIATSNNPIKSRLKGTINAWRPGTVFELENGQRWQVLKGKATLSKPISAPEILVVPGIAGRWFLQVTEDLPKARVERIE